MKKPGEYSFVATGGGRVKYRPAIRIYYESERNGLLFSVFKLPLPQTMTRAEAVKSAKEWAKRPGAELALADVWDLGLNASVMGITGTEALAKIDAVLAAV